MNFAQKINGWYQRNKRDLPWRKTADPYLIWLSEIILQQTRIDQGMNYFLKFQKAFPDVHKLAEAPEDRVLKLWQGLGYYTRARNLHKAARLIVDRHNGRFPDQYHEILALPGVGEYTAAAIASIAFNEAYPVVDGNVLRVISRIYGIDTPVNTTRGKKEITLLLNSLIDTKDPGTFNQALMEFGALHCKPVNPGCSACIFKKECFALKNNMTDRLPRKEGKVSIKKRYFNYLIPVASDSQKTWLSKRTGKDIWKNLYEFPLQEDHRLLATNKIKSMLKDKGCPVDQMEISKQGPDYRHILTHRQISARFFMVRAPEQVLIDCFLKLELNDLFPVNPGEFKSFAISRLTDRFLTENNILPGSQDD